MGKRGTRILLLYIDFTALLRQCIRIRVSRLYELFCKRGRTIVDHLLLNAAARQERGAKSHTERYLHAVQSDEPVFNYLEAHMPSDLHIEPPRGIIELTMRHISCSAG